jgi:hypothetical protein
VQHAIVRLAGLELDEHRLAVRGLEQCEGVHDLFGPRNNFTKTTSRAK